METEKNKKRTISIDQWLKVRDELVRQLRVLTVRAEIDRKTSSFLSKEFLAISSRFPLTHWQRSYLTGIYEAYLECHVKSKIQFAYKINGSLYGVKKKDGFFPHYEESGAPIQEISNYPSGFFYKDGSVYFADENK